MADRPVDDNNEDPGRISDDPSLICSGSSSRMSPSGTPDVKSDGKRKKFRPLDAVRKLFKRRPKLKEIDSARARSTSALYGHVSGDGEEDEEGGFLSRMSLRKNKSRSEDSVLVEARTNQGGGILRKLAYSVEGINRSLYSSNSGKSSSRNSLNSTESQDLFKEGFQGQKSAVEHSEACVDFEVVAKTEALNTDAAKFKISVRPKGRKGSRQNRKNRQKLASNLPCLNEEQQIISNPSLNEDESEEMAAEVEREKLVLNEEGEISLEHLAKHKKESKMQDLPSKPRPKSTPVTIHSTPETKPQRINAILDLESGERPKHFPNPELLEFGKIRSKSLDIEGRVPKSSDLGLSPVRKLNVARKVSKDDKDTRKKSPSGGKSPETNNGELLSANTKSDIGKLYQLDLKKINLEPGSIKFSGSCEKDLDVGLDSQKRPLSPDIGDKNLKPMKSPLRSDFGLRFKQNPDNEEKVPTPIRSPVKSIDLGLWSTKGPIQTPSLESKPLKPLSPTRGSNVELKSISSTPETAEEMKSTKSLKHFELTLKPLKSPVYGPDSSPLSGSRSLQSPVKQTQNVELSCPKGRNKSNDMEEKTRSVSELQESVQKLGKNSEQSQSLQERRLERSDHPNTVQAPTKNKESDEIKTLQLPAPNNEIKDQPKSPKKIFANLELNNLTTKPFRSFSDPKSPRSTLRSTNLSPRSPNLSPRSPILPPKPIRSPVGSRDAKSPTKDFELPKLGLKCDNISDSSENLFSKLPLSPSVSPKTFTVMSQSLKSPTDDKGLYNVSTSVRKPLKELSQVKAQKSPSSDNLCFSDVSQKPLKKVSAEQGLEQKMANRSPLTSPKSEDASENPLLKSINFEPKSQKSSDSTKEVLLKPVKFESKPLKKTNMDDVIPVKKSFEKPNLCPKPLKSHSEASNSGSKLNLASTKINKSNESQTEVEESQSQVGKNREIFLALRNKESNVSVTPKMATGSSRVSAFVNKTDSFISSSNTDEKSKMPDKQNIFSTSVMTNKIKTSDSFKSADSSSMSTTTPKVANALKIDDVSDLNGKSKMALGGYKTGESNKTVQASSSDKSKTAFTSKPSFSSKIATETSKATESSTTSSRKDPEPNLASTTKGADSCQLSESAKVIATPKKLDSSKSAKETSPDEDDIVSTSGKITAADSDTKVTPDPEKPKPFGLTSAASSENVATGIDVSQNNTNRLSALFEARNVTASHVDPPGTTVKIEVIAKDDSDGQKPVKLREKGKSTEKISELSSRQSKVLDLVKNFQKLQAT